MSRREKGSTVQVPVHVHACIIVHIYCTTRSHLAREVEEVDVRVIVGNKGCRRHTQFQQSPWIELSKTGSGEMINEEEEEEEEEEDEEEEEKEEEVCR